MALGDAWGARALIETASEMYYADATLLPHAILPLPDNHEDRGGYVIAGTIEVAGIPYDTGQMMIFRPGNLVSVKFGPQGAKPILLGGATLEEPRYIW